METKFPVLRVPFSIQKEIFDVEESLNLLRIVLGTIWYGKLWSMLVMPVERPL